MWAASFVERRSADNHESERLVEGARGVILFVDVDGERPAAELLVRAEPGSGRYLLAPIHRFEEQSLDGVRGQPEKPDRNVRAVGEHP